MTPEERFEAWWQKAYGWPRDDHRAHVGHDAYLAGYLAGAEDMRERASREVEEWDEFNSSLIKVIRALPPTDSQETK